jgi:hypothetical protein
MSSVTTAQVAERLKALNPDQLAAVYDFAGYLVERSSGSPIFELPHAEQRIANIEEPRADFWPADESFDDFLAAHETWRAQDRALESASRLP